MAIGNHTLHHEPLLFAKPVLVRSSLTQTANIIKGITHDPCLWLFRPPYGSWREKTRPDGPEDAPTSIVAEWLRSSARFADYVGPVKWDIVGKDWSAWQRGKSVHEATRRHLEAIERMGRGIVLMHDSSEDRAMQPCNPTMEMTNLLVPALKERGYRFVPLHAVPSMQNEIQRCRGAVRQNVCE